MAFIVPHIRQDPHQPQLYTSQALALQKCRSDFLSAINFEQPLSDNQNGQTPSCASATPYSHVLPPTPPLTPPILDLESDDTTMQPQLAQLQYSMPPTLREWLFPNQRVRVQPLPPMDKDEEMNKRSRRGRRRVRFGMCERVEWDSGSSGSSENDEEEDPWPELPRNHPERQRRMRLLRKPRKARRARKLDEEEPDLPEATDSFECHPDDRIAEPEDDDDEEEIRIIRRTRNFTAFRDDDDKRREQISDSNNNASNKAAFGNGGNGKQNAIVFRLLASLFTSSKM